MGATPNKPRGPWHDWYHCMGHTYGTWLPGDPKGFRTRHHREHVDGDYRNPPPTGKYASRHQHAKRLMKREPVFLSTDQRKLVAKLLVESLQRRNIEVVVVAITEVHFHLLARFHDHNPRHWVGVAKKESSHYAKAANLGVPGGFWAVRTKDIPIKNRGHQVATAEYIYDHLSEGGAVWYKNRILMRAN